MWSQFYQFFGRVRIRKNYENELKLTQKALII